MVIPADVLMVTVAPGIKAAEGSVMWPRRVPLAAVAGAAAGVAIGGTAGAGACPCAANSAATPITRTIKK